MATGLMGVGLTVLGIVLAYIWKSNGKLQMAMMENQQKMISALERIEKGQEQGHKVIAEMLLNQTKILERIEGKIK